MHNAAGDQPPLGRPRSGQFINVHREKNRYIGRSPGPPPTPTALVGRQRQPFRIYPANRSLGPWCRRVPPLLTPKALLWVVLEH